MRSDKKKDTRACVFICACDFRVLRARVWMFVTRSRHGQNVNCARTAAAACSDSVAARVHESTTRADSTRTRHARRVKIVVVVVG